MYRVDSGGDRRKLKIFESAQKLAQSLRLVQDKTPSKQARSNRKTLEVMSKIVFNFFSQRFPKSENRLKLSKCGHIGRLLRPQRCTLASDTVPGAGALPSELIKK